MISTLQGIKICKELSLRNFKCFEKSYILEDTVRNLENKSRKIRKNVQDKMHAPMYSYASYLPTDKMSVKCARKCYMYMHASFYLN